MPLREPRSQPYRISWPSNTGVSPTLNKALGQQFANIDECLQLIFSLLRDSTAVSTVVTGAAASVSDGRFLMLEGIDGDEGLQGVKGDPGAAGAAGPAGGSGAAGTIGIDGLDGEDAIPVPGPTGATGATGATGPAGANQYAPALDGQDGDDSYPMPTIVKNVAPLIGVTIDGGGSVLTTGAKGYLRVLRAGTLIGWTLMADRAGSVQFDIFKSTFAGYPPAASIVAAAPPLLSAADHGESSTLTGWTISVAAGDVLGFSITSVATIQRVTLQLDLQ